MRHKDVQNKVGDWVLIEDLTPIPGLATKLRPPYKRPAKVIGVSSDGLNCTCEYHNVQGQRKQATHHVSRIKPYQMRHPLKMTIKRTTDGFAVQQTAQQVGQVQSGLKGTTLGDTRHEMANLLKISELQARGSVRHS